MTRTSISILGCGWLGKPLGYHLIQKGYSVKGATTQPEKTTELKSSGIEPYIIHLTPYINEDYKPEFFNSNILVINIPPARRVDVETWHLNQIKSIYEAAKKGGVSQLLFISSSSVYPNVNRAVTEDDDLEPERPAGKALKNIENMLLQSPEFDTTVLRFSGLIGGNRKPGRFLAGKKDVKNGDAPVNLIHRDDCIGLIEGIIENERWGEIFNGCSDEHPLRKDYYIKAAQELGMEPPTFTEEPKSSFKIISNEKIKKALGYKFKYPDPMQVSVNMK